MVVIGVDPNLGVPPPRGDRPALARRTFAGRASEVCQARRWLATMTDGLPCSEDAMLALSELAANAVGHSDSGRPDGTFTVRVAIGAGVLRIEVTDQGGSWQDQCGQVSQRGRGLMIVAAIASAWGVAGDGDGRTVWCELAAGPQWSLPAGSARAAS